MELRQLEYFVAVAEEANFTRAAERVNISQSGVSAQVRRLEDEVGATLIDRSGRTATLTAAGAAALPHARSALAAVGAFQASIDDVNGLLRGRLAVGMVIGCRVTPLFDALAGFHRDHPGVEIALVEDNSDRLVEQIRTGELDLALVAAAGSPPPDLEGFPIVTEGLVAAVPPGHPLATRPGRRADQPDRAGETDQANWAAGQAGGTGPADDVGGADQVGRMAGPDRPGQVRLAEVVAHRVVCLPVGTGIRTAFEQSCAAKDLHPNVTLEASAPDTVADLAARGLGVAVLSESTIAAQEQQLDVLAITDSHTPAVLAVVWATTPSPALNQLVHHCRQAFDQSLE